MPQNLSGKKLQFLNRDAVKGIAMFTMLLSHIAHVFLRPGTVLFELFVGIGYFTAVTMCFFLTEGYYHTHSRKTYGLRLLLFALISEFPFYLAFQQNGNMMFTLFFCFLVLAVMHSALNPALQSFLIMGLILLSFLTDWSVLAPLFTILFVRAGRSREKIKSAYRRAVLVIALLGFLDQAGRVSIGRILLSSLLSAVGIGLSGLCILYFYNGNRMEKAKTFSKWFFYIFYPAHLLILGILRMAVR